jgi:hypothetical protein
MTARMVHPARADESEAGVTGIATAASKISSRSVKKCTRVQFLAASRRSRKFGDGPSRKASRARWACYRLPSTDTDSADCCARPTRCWRQRCSRYNSAARSPARRLRMFSSRSPPPRPPRSIVARRWRTHCLCGRTQRSDHRLSTGRFRREAVAQAGANSSTRRKPGIRRAQFTGWASGKRQIPLRISRRGRNRRTV